MPIHDWTRVPAGLFHDFHQTWTVRMAGKLNVEILPKELSAFLEWRLGGPGFRCSIANAGQ